MSDDRCPLCGNTFIDGDRRSNDGQDLRVFHESCLWVRNRNYRKMLAVFREYDSWDVEGIETAFELLRESIPSLSDDD